MINIGRIFSEEIRKKLSEAKFGKKHSEETRRKISKALFGKKPSDETRKKLSKANLGKKFSEEHKKKISEALLGKTHSCSEEARKKLSEANLGKTQSNETRIKRSCTHQNISREEWAGFVSCEPYCDVWADKEYKESIRERDEYKCQNPFCSTPSKRLAIHHINYNKKNCKPNNLITLCNSCNSKANANRDYWVLLYNEIILNKIGDEEKIKVIELGLELGERAL